MSGPRVTVDDVSTCPDCRYCAPRDGGAATMRWPHPAQWFDQPCVHCAHRLKAHDPGLPGILTVADLQGPEPVAVWSSRR